MIVQEQFEDTNLVHTYSDEGFKIRQVETGIIYGDAIDMPGKYTYEETDELIEVPEPEEEPEENTDEQDENIVEDEATN